MEMLLRTVVFASQKHAGQVRHGGRGIAYVNHPIEVGHWVAKAGGSLPAVCGALLHDVVEDCGVTEDEIRHLYWDDKPFGRHVLLIVQEHTDPPGLQYNQAKEREISLMMSGQYHPDTKLVILADQLCNMLDLVRNPPQWNGGIEQDYINLVKRLVDAGRGTSALIEEEFDCAYRRARIHYGMD